jgi:hypothetical protein
VVPLPLPQLVDHNLGRRRLEGLTALRAVHEARRDDWLLASDCRVDRVENSAHQDGEVILGEVE